MSVLCRLHEHGNNTWILLIALRVLDLYLQLFAEFLMLDNYQYIYLSQ